MIRRPVTVLILALLALPVRGADRDPVEGSVSVESGERVADVSTVDGGIHIAENATVRNINTVNGSIELESSAVAKSVGTVNGGIAVGENARISKNISTVNGGVALGKETKVAGEVTAVNGAVALDNGTEVTGRIANVNGRIRLAAAHVGGGLRTETGDIDVGANARVEGGILVRRSKNISLGRRALPRIVIGPGAIVQGTLLFERAVHLFVSDSASIGPVEGAQVIRFAGERPPDL